MSYATRQMKLLLVGVVAFQVSGCALFPAKPRKMPPFAVVHSLKGVPLDRLFELFGNRPVLDEIQPGFGRHVAIRTVRWARGDYAFEVSCFGKGLNGQWIVTFAQERRRDVQVRTVRQSEGTGAVDPRRAISQ